MQLRVTQAQRRAVRNDRPHPDIVLPATEALPDSPRPGKPLGPYSHLRIPVLNWPAAFTPPWCQQSKPHTKEWN